MKMGGNDKIPCMYHRSFISLVKPKGKPRHLAVADELLTLDAGRTLQFKCDVVNDRVQPCHRAGNHKIGIHGCINYGERCRPKFAHGRHR